MGSTRVLYLKRLVTRAVVLGVLLGTAACASSGGGGGSGSNPDEITREDILANPSYTNAFDLISSIRSRWLRASRGQGASFSSGGATQEPIVMLDGVRYGEIGSLRMINLNLVIRMRYLSATDATTLYGTGYVGGAIQVFTR
jgi:hypothetical protein